MDNPWRALNDANCARPGAGLILGLIDLRRPFVLPVGWLTSPSVSRTRRYTTSAINETDAYNRIYDEVLVDEASADYSGDLLGRVEAATQEEGRGDSARGPAARLHEESRQKQI